MEDKRIVEINGVKIEVDMRTAKRVDSFKIGDSVKVLKKTYSDSYESHFGVIVGFDEFQQLPTIVVAYLRVNGYESPLQFAYLNAKTTDTEICATGEHDIGLEKQSVLDAFDRETQKRRNELMDLERRQAYFEKMFGRYFG